MTAIVCSDLSFSWPDGARVLSGLTLSIGDGRTGLIGVNGSGKSTLLKLIAGELRPASGAVRTSTDIGYLPQAITLGTSRTVSDLLGITVARDALHAIEAGGARGGAAPVGAGRPRLGRPGRAAVRRRARGCRAAPPVPAPAGHPAARRADQPPRPGCAPAAVQIGRASCR